MKQKKHLQYRVTNTDSQGLHVLLWYRQSLVLKNGLLYRTVNLKHYGTTITQFVLPKKFRTQVIMSLHGDCGHLGIERTLTLVKERFFWPQMAEDVQIHITTCERCIHFKQPAE